MSETPGRVLVVDFEPSTLRSTVDLLGRCGGDVLSADSVERLAEAMAGEHPPTVVVMEPDLETADGFELCRALTTGDSDRPAIILASYSLRGTEARRRAEEIGARFLERPFDDAALVEAVREALEREPSAAQAEAPAGAIAEEGPRPIVDAQFESWLERTFPDPASATPEELAAAKERMATQPATDAQRSGWFVGATIVAAIGLAALLAWNLWHEDAVRASSIPKRPALDAPARSARAALSRPVPAPARTLPVPALPECSVD